MKDRLIEWIVQIEREYAIYHSDCEEAGVTIMASFEDMLADHLLAEGVIVPPCKVGDTVYSIKATYSKCHLGTYWDEIRCDGCECTCDSHSTYSIQEETVIELSCGGRYWCVKTNKTNGNFVFLADTPYGRYLAREEAEKALAERREE